LNKNFAIFIYIDILKACKKNSYQSKLFKPHKILKQDVMNIFDEIKKETESGRPCVLVTVINSEGRTPGKPSFKMLVTSDGKSIGTIGGGRIEVEACELASKVMRWKKPELKNYELDKLDMGCGGQLTLFFDYIGAEKQILIFGGGHVGQALYKIAKHVSYNVKVFDNRESLSKNYSKDDFILCDFEKIPLDKIPDSSAFVTIMTYEHKYDFEVLKQILASNKTYKYVGLIGSRKKIPTVVSNLQKLNINIPDYLYAPIGTNIGAVTAEEIAVSILSEIIGVDKNKNVDSMRNLVDYSQK